MRRVQFLTGSGLLRELDLDAYIERKLRRGASIDGMLPEQLDNVIGAMSRLIAILATEHGLRLHDLPYILDAHYDNVQEVE